MTDDNFLAHPKPRRKKKKAIDMGSNGRSMAGACGEGNGSGDSASSGVEAGQARPVQKRAYRVQRKIRSVGSAIGRPRAVERRILPAQPPPPPKETYRVFEGSSDGSGSPVAPRKRDAIQSAFEALEISLTVIEMRLADKAIEETSADLGDFVRKLRRGARYLSEAAEKLDFNRSAIGKHDRAIRLGGVDPYKDQEE